MFRDEMMIGDTRENDAKGTHQERLKVENYMVRWED